LSYLKGVTPGAYSLFTENIMGNGRRYPVKFDGLRHEHKGTTYTHPGIRKDVVNLMFRMMKNNRVLMIMHLQMQPCSGIGL
jgi:hypothetical protein